VAAEYPDCVSVAFLDDVTVLGVGHLREENT
jgi:hypothetical protein